jgi:probable rRNA maturation factor
MNYYIHKKFLEKVAEKALKILKFKLPELSIALVDDARIKELNRKYRKIDRVTDILAFDYGEIIICLDQAKRQAKELNNALKKELSILLVHGILHLAGYDDETKKDFNKMLKKQKEVWQKIKL